MVRLIDADAIISDLEYDVDLDERALDCIDIVEPTRSTIQFDKDCKSNLIDLLKNMPAVEAKPVRHGHWVRKGLLFHCSACSYGAFKSDFVYGARYCPICGARMDKRKTE